MSPEDGRSLVIVFTGDGKGKTTAALGTALRAVGHGLRVLVLQFVKGSWPYGELEAAERLAPLLEIRQCGRGCFGVPGDEVPEQEHREAARRGLEEARREIASGEWDMVVLDEVTLVVDFGFVDLEELLECLRSRPPNVHLLITGRRAHPRLVEGADMVTEMKMVRHPFEKGFEAQKGIEF